MRLTVYNLLTMFILLFLADNIACYEKPVPVAVVTKVKGSCFIIRRDEKIKIQPSMPIYVNDKILTSLSSYVEILFDTGISLRIEENSEFEIKTFFTELQPGKQSFSIKTKLVSGCLLADTEFLQDKYKLNSFVVTTPSIVASVRGTIFYLRISDDQTTNIAVFDGEVDCYLGSMEDEEIDKILFGEEDLAFYEQRKKVNINKDEQIIVSSDLSSFAITELPYDMIEYKKTVVENFVKVSRKNRENLYKWKQKRDEYIERQKEEFRKNIEQQKKNFMEEFEIERIKSKKRSK